MRSKISLLLLASALGACAHTPQDLPDRGLAAVNVPVIDRANYALDIAAPGGSLLSGEAQRLDGWFRALGLGYGDSVYIDGPYADGARQEIAQVAASHGILVEAGAPVTVGAVPNGSVRVVVDRARASVPNCPNWSRPALPNYNNRSHSNYGCAVNSNLAAMVANPTDLIHGRDSAVIDAETGSKALSTYRSKPLTGAGGLKSESTKGN